MRLYKYIMLFLITVGSGFHVKSQDTLNLISTFISEQQRNGLYSDYFQAQRGELQELSSVPYNPMSDTIYVLEMRVFPEMRYILMYWSNKFCYSATHYCSDDPLTVYTKRIYPRIQMSLIEEWDTSSLMKLSAAHGITQSNSVYATRVVVSQGKVHFDHFVYAYFDTFDPWDKWELDKQWGSIDKE